MKSYMGGFGGKKGSEQWYNSLLSQKVKEIILNTNSKVHLPYDSAVHSLAYVPQLQHLTPQKQAQLCSLFSNSQ